jgi:hypothetical protein
MGRNEEPVEITVQILKIGDEAMLVTDGKTEAWVPYSLLDEDSELDDMADEGDQGLIVIPEWKAFDTGFI